VGQISVEMCRSTPHFTREPFYARQYGSQPSTGAGSSPLNFETRFPQIDNIKGIAIVCVLLLHTVPLAFLIESYSTLFIWQAVPIFLIAIGLTWYYSFRKSDSSTLGELYSGRYIMRRLSRFLTPLLLVFAIDLTVTIATNSFGPSMVSTIAMVMVGIMPTYLPGNYFVSLILQLIFIAPLLYYFFTRSPGLALIATFAIDLGFELSGPYIPYSVYSICILRYLAALGLGFYIAPELLSKGKLDLMDRRFVFIVPLAAMSAIFLVLYNSSSFPLFRAEWGTQNLLSFFYPMLLVVLLFRFHLYVSRIDRRHLLELLGRASYHIYLVQMLYFGFVVSSLFTVVNAMPPFVAWLIVIIARLGVNIILGIFSYKVEGRVREKLIKTGHGT